MTFDLSSQDTPFPDPLVKDVTLETFKTDVLEASLHALVLVAFWSPQDMTCRQQVTALANIAKASKGSIRLAKADINKTHAVAVQLGIRSVPAVFAFHGGRPLDAITGALPESQLRVWCDQLLKTTGQNVDASPDIGNALQRADDLLALNEIAQAQQLFEELLAATPQNPEAYLGLIRCALAAKDSSHAQDLTTQAPEAVQKHKMFASLLAALELMEQTSSDEEVVSNLRNTLEQNPADHKIRFDLALALYGEGHFEEAVDHLLDIVQRNRKWQDDAARKQLLKFFEALGDDHPLTISARRRLASLLFS